MLLQPLYAWLFNSRVANIVLKSYITCSTCSSAFGCTDLTFFIQSFSVIFLSPFWNIAMYLTGTYLICRKSQNQNIFYGFFLRACEYGPSTGGQTQATRLRANTGKQNAGRKTHRLPVASSSANTLPPAYFLIQRTKTSGLQQLPLRRLRRRSLSRGSYLTVAHYKQPLTTIILPASVLLFRHHSAPKVHPLCSAAFRNPKMHPHQ